MGFTHFDENGKAVMVDVTAKSETEREATATGRIVVNREVFQAIKAGTAAKGCARRCGHSRDHGCEAYFGSDPHVPYPADHELQDPF